MQEANTLKKSWLTITLAAIAISLFTFSCSTSAGYPRISPQSTDEPLKVSSISPVAIVRRSTEDSVPIQIISQSQSPAVVTPTIAPRAVNTPISIPAKTDMNTQLYTGNSNAEDLSAVPLSGHSGDAQIGAHPHEAAPPALSAVSSSVITAESEPSDPDEMQLPPRKGYMALTFDDGPFDLTAHLLDVLQAEHTRAIFFVTGQHVSERPHLIARMARDVHLIGNHTWDHPDLKTLSLGDVANQLERTSQAIVNAGAPRPDMFRPPFESTSDDIVDTAQAMGMTQVLFNVVVWDWNTPSPSSEKICNDVLIRARPDAIILMHDFNANSIGAIPCIVKGLQASGYELGRISARSIWNGTDRPVAVVQVLPW